MDQVHKRFTAEQVRVLIKGYCQGTLDRSAIQETLGIGKTRFFALLRQYRWGMDEFSLTYQRATPTRLPASAEKQIEAELMLEKGSAWTSSGLKTRVWKTRQICPRRKSWPEKLPITLKLHWSNSTAFSKNWGRSR